MSSLALVVPSSGSLLALQRRFLDLLPRLEAHGRVFFRRLRPRSLREERIAEMIAMSWQWYRRLAEQGKDAAQFPTMLATFAARAVKSGRRLCGKESAKDALSSTAQRRHGFNVRNLPDGYNPVREAFKDALTDNTVTPPDEQACFRIDFPAWLGTRTERDRRVVHDLMQGERACDVSRKYGMSCSRVSQMRRAFHDDWTRFCGDAATSGHTPVSTRVGTAHSGRILPAREKNESETRVPLVFQFGGCLND
jgi:hypothetical protein